MMIAMSLFVIFMGVVIQSYLSIVTTQREANEYRVMYSEARSIFDKFSDEIRNGVISYDQMGVKPSTALLSDANKKLILFSPDQSRAVVFQYLPLVSGVDGGGKIGFAEFKRMDDNLNDFNAFRDQFENVDSYFLNSDRIKVKALNIYISPGDDPFKTENVVKDGLQYQPKVTLFATFSKEIASGKPPLELNLQTTISSRSYVPGYVAPYLRSIVDGINTPFTANLNIDNVDIFKPEIDN